MRCHVAFENASNQQAQILETLAERLGRAGRSELSVVSVGAGSGILDVPLMARLAERADVRYCVIEPLEEQCVRLRERFAAAGLEGRVELTVYNGVLDDFLPGLQFDHVLAIHSIYYMPDLARSLESLANLRSPRGELIVCVAPLEEMNLLAQVFWSPQRPHALWFERDVEEHLEVRGEALTRTRIEGRLDLDASVLEASCTKTDIVDFLIQAPLEKQPRAVRELVAGYLELVSRSDEDGISVPHPAVLFEVG